MYEQQNKLGKKKCLTVCGGKKYWKRQGIRISICVEGGHRFRM